MWKSLVVRVGRVGRPAKEWFIAHLDPTLQRNIYDLLTNNNCTNLDIDIWLTCCLDCFTGLATESWNQHLKALLEHIKAAQ